MALQQKESSSLGWLLALLIAGSVLALRIISLRDVFGPVVYGDEFIYWHNMRFLLFSDGSLNSGYPPLYPFFMTLGALCPDTYRGVLLFNALVGSILPFIGWKVSRDLSTGIRLTAVALLSVLPLLFVYPRMMMSENLFVPLVVLTFWALYTAVRGWSNWWFLAAGFLLWLACMTRYQGVPFVIAAVLAVTSAGGTGLVVRQGPRDKAVLLETDMPGSTAAGRSSLCGDTSLEMDRYTIILGNGPDRLLHLPASYRAESR